MTRSEKLKSEIAEHTRVLENFNAQIDQIEKTLAEMREVRDCCKLTIEVLTAAAANEPEQYEFEIVE